MRNSNVDIVFGKDTSRESVNIVYWLSIGLCVITLLFSVFVFFFISKSHKDNESIIPQFKLALENGDYKEALEMYRKLHDEVVSADPGEIDKYEFQISMMNEMENIVSEKVVTIENKIRYERYNLKNFDLKFLNGMEELTNSQLSNWLNSLCEEFLLGTIEKPDVTFIFNEVINVDKIDSVASPLLREIDSIEKARGVVQSAETAYEAGDYISSVQQYNDLVSNSEGFVLNFATNRVEEIKDIMYAPMLTQCEHMLDNFQYYCCDR